MNQDNMKIYCPRCGSEMNSNSRYCMKCGYLNANNEANQNMQQYIPKQEVNSYQIGSGQNINQPVVSNNNQIVNSIATDTGNKLICFLVNYFIYLLVLGISFFTSFNKITISLDTLKNSTFIYVAFISSIVFLFIYSMQLIFMKCNKRWWAALVPVYNFMILTEIVFNKKWLGLLLLIPGVGQVFLLVIFYIMGTKFKFNGLLTMLFPIIFIPIMGFGSRFYEGRNYVNEERDLEKDYKRKKIFFITILIFLVLSFVVIFWANIIDVKNKARRITNYYYVFATHQVVKKAKQLGEENYLVCDDYEYSSDSGIYYVELRDMGKVAYLPFYYMREVIGGYVIIDNSGEKTKYYISMSDGAFGYPEMNSDDVSLDKITEYKEVIYKSEDTVNYCRNTKHSATVGEM